MQILFQGRRALGGLWAVKLFAGSGILGRELALEPAGRLRSGEALRRFCLFIKIHLLGVLVFRV